MTSLFRYLALSLALWMEMTSAHAVMVTPQPGVQLVKFKDARGQEVGLYKQSHALIVGVSDYRAGWPPCPA